MELSNLVVGDEERIQIVDKRFYLFNGDLYPSVTTILGVAKEGKQLREWQGKVGNEQAAQILYDAGIKGTNVHNGVELLLMGKELDFSNYTMDEWRCLIAASRFIKDYKVEPILIEATLKGSHTYNKVIRRYAGSCDLVCYITEPRSLKRMLTVLDWKTSKSLHEAHDIQLLAYDEALAQTKEIVAEHWLVVQIGNKTKKGYTAHVVKKSNHDKLLRKWYLYNELWHMQNPNIKMRYQELPKHLKIEHLTKEGNKL